MSSADGPTLVREILAEAVQNKRLVRREDLQVRGPLDFRGTRVDVPIVFERCTFDGQMDFSEATLASVEFLSCVFLPADGNKGAPNASEASPEIGLKLERARLSGRLFAPDLQSPQLRANGVRISGDLLLGEPGKKADVGLIELSDARIDGSLGAVEMTCASSIDLDGLRVGRAVTLTNSKLGGAMFRSLSVGTQLNLEGVTFRWGTFVGMHVADHANFRRAEFLSSDVPARFTGVTVEGDAAFEGVIFSGPATFAGIRVSGSIRLQRATFKGKVDFERASVGGDFKLAESGLKPAKFLDGVSFSRMEIGAMTDFGEAEYEDTVALDDATYAHVSDPVKLFELLVAKVDTGQPFTQLELVARRNGQVDLAKEVYFRWKIKEWQLRKEAFSAERNRSCSESLSMLLTGLWRWLLRLTVGYGVYPQRLLLSVIVLVGLGAAIYSLGTTNANTTLSPSPVDAITASMENLLPGSTSQWRPVSSYWGLALVGHRILAWFIGAVGLLGIGGFFRRYD